MSDVRQRFRELHAEGCFLMPNPWDVGSACRFAAAGFPALATTSSGHAASVGKQDGEITLDELVIHTAAITAAVDVPLNVDAERCFDDVAETVERLAAAGASGVSIEDWSGTAIEALGVAVERVAEAVAAAGRTGVLVTARAENLIHGVDDLDDTIARLIAYRDAGAECLYAPGLVSLDDVRRVVDEIGAPVNVLARPRGPATAELAAAGVRRVSTGGALARAAYDEAVRRAEALR